MASESKKNSTGKATSLAGVESLTVLNQSFAQAITEASRAYIEGIVALQEEILGFANTRLRDNEESRDALLSCNDLSEALRIQQAWARKVSERYICEAQKLVEMASETSSNSWSPLLAGAKEPATKPKTKQRTPSSKPKAPQSRSKAAISNGAGAEQHAN